MNLSIKRLRRLTIGRLWIRFWMLFAGTSPQGRLATWLATLFARPHYGRHEFALWSPKGYISAKAEISHGKLRLGANVFIDDRVLIYEAVDSAAVELGDKVHLYRDIIIQTGQGGSVKIGRLSYIQPRCIFSAFKGPIQIGENVQIASNCTFYSYDHGIAPGERIIDQPLQTKGGIIIENDAWIGVGVTVLDGVRIGKGAVVGAGSVVIKDVPDGAVVMGVPACIVKMRG